MEKPKVDLGQQMLDAKDAVKELRGIHKWSNSNAWPRDYNNLVWKRCEGFERAGDFWKSLELRRRACLVDHWFFCRFILEYRDIENKFHIGLCSDLDEIDTRKALAGNLQDVFYMLPRGHLKSSMVTKAKSIVEMLKWPDIRIAVISETEDTAENHVVETRDILAKNELLKILFPDRLYMKPDDPKEGSPLWTRSSFTIKREFKGYEHGPTMARYGILALDTGTHFHLGIFDDLVGEKNSQSSLMIEKTKAQCRMVLPHLEPGAPRIFVGTAYDWADQHMVMLRKSDAALRRKEVPTVRIFTQGIKYPDGTYIFPQKFNDVVMKRIRDEMTAEQVAAQYDMLPINPKKTKLQTDWLRYFSVIHSGGKDYSLNVFDLGVGRKVDVRLVQTKLNVFITVDMATSKPTAPNFTVLTVTGVDEKNNWYVLQYKRGHFAPSQTIDIMMGMSLVYKPITLVGIEEENISVTMREDLENEMFRRNILFPIDWIRPRGPKIDRIAMALEPRMRAGHLYIQEDMNELEEEFTWFGTGTGTLDILDTLANVAKVSIVPDTQEEENELTGLDKELYDAYNYPGRPARQPHSSARGDMYYPTLMGD